MVYLLIGIGIALLAFGAKSNSSSGEEYIELDRDELIQRMINQALYDASQGDAKARDWITKYAIEKTTKDAPAKKGTPQNIVDDTVMALRALGFKKHEATARVNECVSKKKYTKTETLLQDCM